MLGGALAGALLPAFSLPAAGEEENFFTVGPITVGLPWARAARAGTATFAFFKIDNAGAPDMLVSASTEVAESVEIVGLAIRDGAVTTIPIGPVELPAGRMLFDPGGLALSLVGLRRDLAVGEAFQLDLVFGMAGALSVTVGVEAPDARLSSEDH
jgi:copper(I)-binding protein